MNEEFRDSDRRVINPPRDSLVERLDPALGEASSGIGVLLSELVRRTLRGGVAKIEEEMHDFVEEKLGQAVEGRMPQFQDAATQTAERKAEAIARREVESVERQARESVERLSQDIAASEQRSEITARTVTQEAVAVVGQETKAAAEKLQGDIADTERRAEARARELVAEHVEELKQRSKQTYVQVRELLDELNRRMSSVDSQVARERQERETAIDALRETVLESFEAQTQELRTLLHQLAARNEHLEARLAELEKPRGWRALWRRMFGRKAQQPGLRAPAPGIPESVEA
jgi:hypothetical protein